ncbi:glycine-N-acyltransferase-like protein 3 isoform X2 [Saccostrea echinata]|uniref:glycine-N-acyltransferase-like protein 3 isoform X2 n=1 Tax=Saccostrea echinata TaxID=191078 RepID=UPI002A839B21|nr:glycine-N-acyltransferase-like protein 3 isoform X2 [Saccostrea echinata]
MAQKIASRLYEELENILEKELPFSIQAYYPLKLLRKRLLKNRIVWVDKWPDFRVVVVSDDRHKDASPQRVYCFCRDQHGSSSLDSVLSLVSEYLSNSLLMFGCRPRVADDLIKCRGSSVRRLSSDAYMLTLPKENIISLPIPDDFKVTCLSEHHLDTVVKEWPYSGVFSDAKEWIREMIGVSPSVCVENKEGQPIAWVLQQDYGCIGMLQVIAEYKRAKLGSAVTMLLAQKLREEGLYIYSAVNVENSLSVAFHKKNGFQFLPDFLEAFVEYGFNQT